LNMQNCAEHVKNLYLHPKVNELIGKINPPHLRDDLRQELAETLLNYDCDKLVSLSHEGNLLAFTLRVAWNMGTLPNGNFYRKYRKSDREQLMAYLRTFKGKEMPVSYAKVANDKLTTKLSLTANDAHESMIFQQYVELRSIKKVAKFFGLPYNHVRHVVESVRNELKKDICTYQQ